MCEHLRRPCACTCTGRYFPAVGQSCTGMYKGNGARISPVTDLRQSSIFWFGIGLTRQMLMSRARSFGQSLGADSSLESGRNQLLLGIGLPCLILELIPRTSLSFRWCGQSWAQLPLSVDPLVNGTALICHFENVNGRTLFFKFI